MARVVATAVAAVAVVAVMDQLMVVVVAAGPGAVSELPWRHGMRLAQVMQAGRLSGTFEAARIFRGGAVTAADLASKRSNGADWPLHPGDVVEFRH